LAATEKKEDSSKEFQNTVSNFRKTFIRDVEKSKPDHAGDDGKRENSKTPEAVFFHYFSHEKSSAWVKIRGPSCGGESRGGR